MRLWFTSACLTCKRLAREKAFLLTVLLLVAVLSVCSAFLERGQPVAVLRVAVVFDPADDAAVQVYGSLPQSRSVRFEAYLPSGRAAVEEQVRTGALECAYVLTDNFAGAIGQGRLPGSVELLVSPGTACAPILNEMVFSAVLQYASRAIATEQVRQVFDEDPALIAARIDDMITAFENDPELFVRQQSAESGFTDSGRTDTPLASNILRGVTALFLLAMELFLLPKLVADKQPGLWRKLGAGGLIRYYAGVWTALTVLCFGAGALALAAFRMPGGPDSELPALLAYAAALSMLDVLAVSLLRGSGPVYACGIFALLITLVFGGVLFDWREINAAVAGVCRWLPTSLYQAAAGQDVCALRCLAAGTVLCAAAAAACLVRRGRRAQG